MKSGFLHIEYMLYEAGIILDFSTLTCYKYERPAYSSRLYLYKVYNNF